MDAREVILFRTYTSLEEPALTTPFGFMSMRSVIVIALSACIAGGVYMVVVPENMNIHNDWILVLLSFTPIGIGMLLAVVGTPYGTVDALLIAVIKMMIRNMMYTQAMAEGGGENKKTKKTGMAAKRVPSTVLGFGRRLVPYGVSSRNSGTMEIVCADLDELKSIRITIYDGTDGHPLGNRLVSCYLDDELLDTVRTSHEGLLVLHVRPEKEGGRMLIVRDAVPEGDDNNTSLEPSADKSGAVLLRRSIHFKLRGV